MSALHHLIYVSRSKIDACGPEPRHILEVGRSRNAALSVTGLLVYSGDHFAQWLEGDPEALETLMRAIRADERHTILHEWPASPISHRRHGHWSLGYVYDDSVENWLRAYDSMPLAVPPVSELAEHVFSRADVQ